MIDSAAGVHDAGNLYGWLQPVQNVKLGIMVVSTLVTYL
jgi:hypothetical protein